MSAPRLRVAPTFHRIAPNVALVRGEATQVLQLLPDDSLEAFLTDPPSGAEFMGKSWDCFRRAHNPNDVGRSNVFGRTSRTSPHSYGESSRSNFVATMTAIFAEVYRTLLPGAWGAVWALPRTSHWTAWALEDAGFEIRDSLHHLFGQGFPKSLDLGKALDKRAGVKPLRTEAASLGMAKDPQWHALQRRLVMPERQTEAARRWDGWHTALKPGHEVWWLVRKPFKGSAVRNVLCHGTGAINVGACRLGGGQDRWSGPRNLGYKANGTTDPSAKCRPTMEGRHPPNFAFTHSPGCEPGAPCEPGCPVAGLDAQSGARKSGTGAVKRATAKGFQGNAYGAESRPVGTAMVSYGDSGGASRFFPVFYCAKPTKKEKNAGLEHLPAKTPEEITGRKAGSAGLVMEGGKANPYAGPSGKARPNHHPTPKATSLCAWLARLITPPGGTVLDTFSGSASIGVSCVQEGFGYLGIERDEDGKGRSLGYVKIGKGRLEHAVTARRSSAPE